MIMRTQAALWPPNIGDYVRVRESGVLGEVVEIEGRGVQQRYTLSPFRPTSETDVSYRLHDLEPVW